MVFTCCTLNNGDTGPAWSIDRSRNTLHYLHEITLEQVVGKPNVEGLLAHQPNCPSGKELG